MTNNRSHTNLTTDKLELYREIRPSQFDDGNGRHMPNLLWHTGQCVERPGAFGHYYQQVDSIYDWPVAGQVHGCVAKR